MSPEQIMALRAVLGVPAGDVFAVLAWDSPGTLNGWRLAAVGKGRVRFLGEPYPGAKAPPLETFLEALEIEVREAPEGPRSSGT